MARPKAVTMSHYNLIDEHLKYGIRILKATTEGIHEDKKIILNYKMHKSYKRDI